MRKAILAIALTAAAIARPDAARASDDESIRNALESLVLPFQVHGFVDASYAGNVDLRTDTFGLDQAEVDITRSGGERWALRADLEWVKDGENWSAAVEQGYLEWEPCPSGKAALTLGRFNAPMGFELLDAPDMYQFSHALVFDYGLPSNLTGVMAALAPAERLDLRLFVVNGWDGNDLGGRGPKTAGGRLGWSLGDQGTVGISAIHGSENAGTDEDPATLHRTAVDLDLTWTPAEGLVIGGEANHGTLDAGGGDADWSAFLLMAHRDFTSWVGLTARYDWFDDPDGAIFEPGLAQTRTAITVAPTFALADGLGAVLEVRIDGSSEDVCADVDGEAGSSTTGVAFEVTGSF